MLEVAEQLLQSHPFLVIGVGCGDSAGQLLEPRRIGVQQTTADFAVHSEPLSDSGFPFPEKFALLTHYFYTFFTHRSRLLKVIRKGSVRRIAWKMPDPTRQAIAAAVPTWLSRREGEDS